MPRKTGQPSLTFAHRLLRALPRNDLDRLAMDCGVVDHADFVRPYIENRMAEACEVNQFTRDALSQYITAKLGG